MKKDRTDGQRYSVVDLFCGAGEFDIGFEQANYNIKLCIDSNDLVEKTHNRNFSYIPFINKDIREVTAEEIKEYFEGELDVVIGGPPCQGFSTIGKRVSSDPTIREKHDPRNELVLSYSKYSITNYIRKTLYVL